MSVQLRVGLSLGGVHGLQLHLGLGSLGVIKDKQLLQLLTGEVPISTKRETFLVKAITNTI